MQQGRNKKAKLIVNWLSDIPFTKESKQEQHRTREAISSKNYGQWSATDTGKRELRSSVKVYKDDSGSRNVQNKSRSPMTQRKICFLDDIVWLVSQ